MSQRGRTHLNRELIELPDGVKDRNEAISQRIKSAGVKRKITPDQVRAIRVMLSGTHEDIMKIHESGRIDEWCNDNLQWLYKNFGRENTVSAVLHMDPRYRCADSNRRAQEGKERTSRR